MFFRIFFNLNQSKSLQALPDGNAVVPDRSVYSKKKENGERTSRCIPISCRGSMTVEAALVFPIFLFGMIAFLYLFFLIQHRVQVGRELTDAGKEASCMAYFAGQQNEETELLRLRSSYEVQFPPGISWFHPIRVTQTRTVRRWIGFNGRQQLSENGGEELVYITDYGEVYHRKLSCRYLNLSIGQESLSEVGKLRNADGSKYTPCERCWTGTKQQVYITNYGDRYHESLNCPGLVRGIHAVPVSEIGGLPPCSACGW